MTAATVTKITGGPLVGKITCKICGEVFTRAQYMSNNLQCMNEGCMSRKTKRLQRQAQRALEEANRNQHLESTRAEITTIIKTTEYDGMPEPKNSEEQLLYVEVADVYEEQISVKRVPI